MPFSFSFSGDDIDIDPGLQVSSGPQENQLQPQTFEHRTSEASAFPIPGKPQLPPMQHGLDSMLSSMPSKIAYSILDVCLDDGQTLKLPRRELWDVRVQLMAEAENEEGCLDGELGDHDVKTGVYEGGFKSWESSVDLVKVLSAESHPNSWQNKSARIIELGCGTALPSLAMFQWTMAKTASNSNHQSFSFILADYNPSVLRLVTLPNFILSWALYHQHTLPALQDAFSLEGELELNPDVLDGFCTYLSSRDFHFSFLSGGWSPDFIELLYSLPHASIRGKPDAPSLSLLLGAETIYSPFALQSFTEIVWSVLKREARIFSADASVWVAAKKLYFGVGGSLDDFVMNMQTRGAVVATLRQETEGVRRGVVCCFRSK
ncbi:hypothetical protein EsDP_00006488 [Epichloe bromicola]|uniref:protein-histidine N-methyltransferase n=1 Tax=Epichloe bromicola TaxID=79588 RepID=A0ABQ0CXS6_9HYPO